MRLPVLATGVLILLSLVGCSGEPETTAPSSDATLVEAAATAPPALIQVSAGGGHTCGLTAGGLAWCWGENSGGQLGDGSDVSSSRPVAVAGGHSFRQISTSTGQTCAVTFQDRAYCWGNAVAVGAPFPPTGTFEPVAVASNLRFQSVSAGGTHACAITVGDRKAWCWGINDKGEVGDGTLIGPETPVPVAGNHAWRQISTGNLFTCGITTSKVPYCWGSDFHGTLGEGSTRHHRLTPTPVAGDHRFIQISAGEEHVCAVTGSHRVWCWGEGGTGAIGDGKTFDRFIPRLVAGGHTFDRVTAGGQFTCAEATTNETWCWGVIPVGHLGDRNLVPALVPGGFHFVQVDAGPGHVCGRTSDNVVRCWGSGGPLGDGTRTPRPTPTPIVGP